MAAALKSATESAKPGTTNRRWAVLILSIGFSERNYSKSKLIVPESDMPRDPRAIIACERHNLRYAAPAHDAATRFGICSINSQPSSNCQAAQDTMCRYEVSHPENERCRNAPSNRGEIPTDTRSFDCTWISPGTPLSAYQIGGFATPPFDECAFVIRALILAWREEHCQRTATHENVLLLSHDGRALRLV